MSITMERPATTWEARPGWGIAVDLTPREVVQARQVRVHKRLIALGLVLVLAVCAGLALITMDSRSAAEDTNAEAASETQRLTSETQQYAVLTTMQRVVEQIGDRLAVLMVDDVDYVNLMARIRTALPTQLTLNNASVTLSPPVAGLTDGATSPAQIIGSISLAGTSGTIKQVTPFVAALNRLRGIVDVVPTSVTKTDDGASYTLTMNITDELYTHRFDSAAAAETGGVQ